MGKNSMTICSFRSLLGLLAGLMTAAALLVPQAAQARAGKVLFVLGGASIERGQTALAAQRGAVVQPGDTLVTGLSGRMHVRMQDGALISLKPDTRFTIEAYEPPAPAEPETQDDARADTPTDDARASGQSLVGSARPQGLAVLSLLRGGFRTLTGLIGKQDKASYQLKTPVATIGIRGTDYSVYQCASNCSNADGLYLGVWAGGVIVSNDAGTEEFDAGEFGYVASQTTPPTQTKGDPVVTTETPPPPAEDDDEGEDDTESEEDTAGNETPAAGADDNTDDPGDDSFAEGGSESAPPENRPVEPDVPDDEEPPVDNRPFRSLAYGPVPDDEGEQFVSASTTRNAALNTDNELVAFVGGHPNGTGDYRIGTAEAINLGFDPDTSIRWGRWAGGIATVAVDGGPAQNLDLNDASLHYVVTPALAAVPAVPIEGTASFTLVGNTNPTDSNGNVGVLGSAFLGANFTDQTVDSSVNLSINDDVWNASGSGSIANGTNLFGGQYDVVNVNGQSSTDNRGSFSGFFGPALPNDGLPSGAGLTYTLTDGSTDVSGAAVFGDPTPGASTGGQ